MCNRDVGSREYDSHLVALQRGVGSDDSTLPPAVAEKNMPAGAVLCRDTQRASERSESGGWFRRRGRSV
jgi:hypothetical protein